MARRHLPIIVAGRIRPRIRASEVVGRKFVGRDSLLMIRFAARRQLMCRIRYMRIQDSLTKYYVIEPYSFRYRMTRDGVRKMLFAYHNVHDRIHGFAVRNILEVRVLDRRFKPRWKVEL